MKISIFQKAMRKPKKSPTIMEVEAALKYLKGEYRLGEVKIVFGRSGSSALYHLPVVLKEALKLGLLKVKK